MVRPSIPCRCLERGISDVLPPTAVSFYLRETRISIHFTFILLVVGALFFGWIRELVLVFGALATHEMAHYLVMKGYDLKLVQLDLLPFGARMEVSGLSGRPDAEAPIAVAGPLNNFLLLGLGLLLVAMGFGGGYWWNLFLSINLSLALFNLIPALPLDGGRMFRSYLGETMGVAEGTRVMAWSGIGWGVLMVGAAVFIAAFYSIYMWAPAILAVVLFVTALEEWVSVPTSGLGNLYRRSGARGRDNAPPPIEPISAYGHETVTRVSRRLGRYGFAVIWVLDEELCLLGTLTEDDLRKAVSDGKGTVSLKSLLR